MIKWRSPDLVSFVPCPPPTRKVTTQSKSSHLCNKICLGVVNVNVVSICVCMNHIE